MPTAATIDDLPGPPRIPVLGNLHQIRAHDAHLTVERWSRRYGPVFRFDLGPRRWIGISDGTEIHRLLRERPDGFRRVREIKLTADEADSVGLFTDEGEGWRRSRRLVVSALNAHRLQGSFQLIATASERLRRALAREAEAGRTVDIAALLKRFTVDVTSGLVFGQDLNTLENPDHELQAHIEQILETNTRRVLAPVRYWRWVRLPTDRAYDRSRVAIQQTVADFIAAARERMAARPELFAEPENLLEGMLAAQREDGTFTDAEIAGNVLNLLIAGEDTTAYSSAWTLWFLARHPEVQARCAAEAQAALAGTEAPADPDSLDDLEYTEAALRESMRLKAVAPATTLEPIDDVAIAGTTVPAGTALWLATRGFALGAVERGAEFDPERWLGPKDSAVRPDQRSFLAFGAGPRFCPGRNLAFLEAKAALATILATFEVELDPAAEPVTEFLNFTMAPKNLRIRASVRTRAPADRLAAHPSSKRREA
ncbi:MAG TPA: cytochrome P450 [Solirubrobacterales bacterium]|nr:cytochrome P450 [Solirubrobacterales bacterium]